MEDTRTPSRPVLQFAAQLVLTGILTGFMARMFAGRFTDANWRDVFAACVSVPAYFVSRAVVRRFLRPADLAD